MPLRCITVPSYAATLPVQTAPQLNDSSPYRNITLQRNAETSPCTAPPSRSRTQPYHCVAKLGITSAQHRSATPLHRLAPLCPAERCYADASHHFDSALLCRATPQLCSATQNLRFVQLCDTLPSHRISRFADASLCTTMPSLSCAHSTTPLHFAIPSLCSASPAYHNFSAHRVTLPPLCYAVLC